MIRKLIGSLIISILFANTVQNCFAIPSNKPNSSNPQLENYTKHVGYPDLIIKDYDQAKINGFSFEKLNSLIDEGLRLYRRKNYEQAEKVLLEALEKIDALNLPNPSDRYYESLAAKAVIETRLAKICLLTNKPEKVNVHLESAKHSFLESGGNISGITSTAFFLGQYCQAQGDSESAICCYTACLYALSKNKESEVNNNDVDMLLEKIFELEQTLPATTLNSSETDGNKHKEFFSRRKKHKQIEPPNTVPKPVLSAYKMNTYPNPNLADIQCLHLCNLINQTHSLPRIEKPVSNLISLINSKRSSYGSNGAYFVQGISPNTQATTIHTLVDTIIHSNLACTNQVLDEKCRKAIILLYQNGKLYRNSQLNKSEGLNTTSNENNSVWLHNHNPNLTFLKNIPGTHPLSQALYEPYTTCGNSLDRNQSFGKTKQLYSVDHNVDDSITASAAQTLRDKLHHLASYYKSHGKIEECNYLEKLPYYTEETNQRNILRRAAPMAPPTMWSY